MLNYTSGYQAADCQHVEVPLPQPSGTIREGFPGNTLPNSQESLVMIVENISLLNLSLFNLLRCLGIALGILITAATL